MKQVEIKVVEGNPICRYREAEINYHDRENWLIMRGDWTQYNFPSNAPIGTYILRLYDASILVLQSKNILVENGVKPRYLPLLHSKNKVGIWHPESSDIDRIRILHIVAEDTGDDELNKFATWSTKKSGKAEAYHDAQAKTDKRIDKANKTKKLKPKGPGDKHIIAAYVKAFREDGMPEGDAKDAKPAFWKKVIRYANAARAEDFDIEADPKPWGVTWRTAENRVSKLRKEGFIKQ
jgi:hypothetical protein